MLRHLTVAVGLVALTAAGPAAAPVATPQALYAAALARERAVRPALADPEATDAVLKDVRAAVKAYGSIVRQYPTSGYCDNALWQAARLSLDAFDRFKQPQDRNAGVQLLRWLTAEYPTSPLARSVPAALTSTGAPWLATIRDIRRSVLADAVRVTIELDAEVPFHDERLPDPARVFLDLPFTHPALQLLDRTLRFESDPDIVRQVRIGRHPGHTTRVVLDAIGVSSYSVYALYHPYRIVIDCIRSSEPARDRVSSDQPRVAGSAPSRPAPARSPGGPVPTATGLALNDENRGPHALTARQLLPSSLIPDRRPRASLLIYAARQADAALPAEGTAIQSAAPAAATPPPVIVAGLSAVPPAAAGTDDAPPAESASAEPLSMARQLGLRVSRVVIDPGHGGYDPGATGKGITEAELVLDVALRLEKLLAKDSEFEVTLTRRTDDFVPLQERTAIANRGSADLFLSIHANASPNPQAHGVETYFLNFATNLSAAAVAARENAASGQAMGALPDLVKSIALNNKLDESRALAGLVQDTLVERLRASNKTMKNLGVKQAPFVVLIGAAMPSVLAEISFVTNAQEAKLARSSAYRQRIAEALANAIRRYRSSLTRVTTVAHK